MDQDNQNVDNDTITLANVAFWMIILGVSWFLLRELGSIIKPLLLAILCGYLIIPLHLKVKKHFPGRLSIVAMGLLSIAIVFVLTVLIQTNLRELLANRDVYNHRATERFELAREYTVERLPWTSRMFDQLHTVEADSDSYLRDVSGRLINMATDTASTAVVVILYLLFLLVEAGKFSGKIRSAFSESRAQKILNTIESVNHGIAGFFSAKVKASLILAIPVFIVLFVFRTPFALMWALLTFFCNFIPYIGSVIAFGVPTGFAVIEFGFGWETLVIAICLLAIHISTASFVEPAIIGKAVGVSPVVILFSLAFWGYCWGITGMLLAVPLTVIMKISMEHIESTKPVAKIISD